MPAFIDQIGRKVHLDKFPVRIISLVPSQTELLYDLGLNERVVGITKFCVHPESWYRTKTRIGGTKELKMDIIRQLQPDLVIANKEENVKEQVEELANTYPTWVSDVNTIEDATAMIDGIGAITGKNNEAKEIVTRIRAAFAQFQSRQKPIETCYLIWRKPYMTVGGDTFIHSMMTTVGLNNMYKNSHRYPEVRIEDLRNCELLLLSSEPYPFKQAHIDELRSHLPNTRIMLVDGEMFSWYGSRMLLAPAYMKGLLKEI